jgi:hypothetical protein
MLEGESDTFRFYRKREMLTANRTKATLQNKKPGTDSSVKPPPLNKRLKAKATYQTQKLRIITSFGPNSL